MNPERDLDVVVFGATGVTGRQVGRYLTEVAPIGGRGARSGEARGHPGGGRRGRATIAADVGDPASLAAMAARAKVVLNLVGPYTTRAGR